MMHDGSANAAWSHRPVPLGGRRSHEGKRRNAQSGRQMERTRVSANDETAPLKETRHLSNRRRGG